MNGPQIAPLRILSTKNTPLIVFDPVRLTLVMSGISTPENTPEFYKPLFDLLEDLQAHYLSKLSIKIKLVYFNSSSAKALFNIFKLLSKLKEHTEISIVWYCDPEDEDMFDIIEDFEDILDLEIKIVEQALVNHG